MLTVVSVCVVYSQLCVGRIFVVPMAFPYYMDFSHWVYPTDVFFKRVCGPMHPAKLILYMLLCLLFV